MADQWTRIDIPYLDAIFTLNTGKRSIICATIDEKYEWSFWATDGDEIYEPDPVILTLDRVNALLELFTAIKGQMEGKPLTLWEGETDEALE